MLQDDLQYTLEVHKSTLVKLSFSHILQLFVMIAWGVGAMPLNVQAKLEHDEDPAFVIRLTRTEYAKAFKGTWMEHDWKFTSNKIVWHNEIGLLMRYHDSKMIHCR
jgi:hypothetical protein